MPTSPKKDIERYLRHGQHDDFFRAWPGDDFLARAKCGDAALREALIATVRERTRHATVPEALAGIDVVAFTRAKVAPMVRGLFPRDEQETVLDVLGRSVVFVTPDTITTVLTATRSLSTAWDLANLYLESCDAELLGPDARQIVGLSEETTCYVSADYFRAPSRYADFVVHEAAHIFHNCKRRSIGLREIRGREWLLEIDFPAARNVRLCLRSLQPHLRVRRQPPRATAAAGRPRAGNNAGGRPRRCRRVPRHPG